MKISVIIPTFNEEYEIIECLQSLSLQTQKNFEVIVVDDGSTDQTLKSLLELEINNLRFEVLNQKHLGPASARNLGAKNARGEILVFVDADMTFDKKFLQMLTSPIVTGKAKGTFSKEEYVQNWDNAWARCWNINSNLPKKRRIPKNFPDQHEVFRAIIKKEFDRVNGFDKGGYTDDYTLSNKLGYKADVAPHAFYYHNNPSTLAKVFRQSKWVVKRKYKFGIIGFIAPLVRNFLPIALIVGVIKAIWYKELKFIIFKIFFALGAYVGLLELLFRKKLSK